MDEILIGPRCGDAESRGKAIRVERDRLGGNVVISCPTTVKVDRPKDSQSKW